MWRSGASEAVIKLPKKKYTPKQDVQLGTEAASAVRKQYPIIVHAGEPERLVKA
jgi:hypothetical protein